MNIFTEISGLKGENLSSGILRFLLLESVEFRKSFLDYVSALSPQGILTSTDEFICKREDVDINNKRIDLFIQDNNFILGIENKFFADFQDNQLINYLVSLRDKSNSNGNKIDNVIIAVLAPASRKEEIEKHINDQFATDTVDTTDSFIFLEWEEIILLINDELKKKMSLQNRVIADFFKDFINTSVAFCPNFKRIYPHLIVEYPKRGNSEQKIFISEFARLVPDKNHGDIGSGDYHRGFSFKTTEKDIYLWLGLSVRPKESVLNGNEAGLFLFSSCDISTLGKYCDSISPLKIECWLDVWRNTRLPISNIWEIKFDETWDKPDNWKKYIINPILKFINSK